MLLNPSSRDLRTFGLIWSAIFAFLAYKLSAHFLLFFCLFLLFFLPSLFKPQLFFQIKVFQTWVKIGNLLGKINSFIISFILFYGIFFPIGIFLRLSKKDLLKKKLNPLASTYFIDRTSQPIDMKNQF
jgi:hypothetical protein